MKKENNSAHNHNRGSFSGRIGYVLAVAGSAVGLGNIWRFPYLAAKYGGGIFLLIYILLTASFGYVLIMSETALGRMTRKSPVGAFEHFGKTKSFKIGGWLNAVIPMPALPFVPKLPGFYPVQVSHAQHLLPYHSALHEHHLHSSSKQFPHCHL